MLFTLYLTVLTFFGTHALELDCGDPKDFVLSSMKDQLNVGDAINDLEKYMGPFAQEEVGQIKGLLGLDDDSGSTGKEALESKCLKNAFGGSSASDTTFGKIAFDCITVTMQKKVTQCLEDIEKKKLDAATGCFLAPDKLKGLISGGGIGDILGGLGGAAAGGGAPAAGGIPDIGGFLGRRRRSAPLAISRKRRFFPFGGGAADPSNIASSIIPSSGSDTCIPPTEIPLRMCMLEAEQENCRKMRDLLEKEDCSLCDVITMAFRGNDIATCACAHLDFSNGFDASKVKGNVESCVTDQVAQGLVEQQLMGGGSPTSGDDLSNLAKLGGIDTDKNLVPAEVTKNTEILKSFTGDSLPVGDLKMGNLLKKAGQTEGNNDFMKCGKKE